MIIVNKAKFLLLSLICFCITISAQNSGDALYDNSYLHEIRIESDTIEDLWNAISRDYVMVNVRVDGHSLDSVGLRLKGFTSAGSLQKPLKIDINKFVSGKKYDGLKEFNLHNNFKDSFLQREALAYKLYERVGLPSPRTSYAEVIVGGVFRGIYSIAEPIDKSFLKRNFSRGTGSLYKGPTGFGPRVVELKEGSMDAFNRFKNNASASNLEDYVNLDHYLKQMAVDIIIGDWDSYAYDRHNYYIYYDPTSERLNFINWDHNYAFSEDDKDLDLYPRGTFPSPYNFIDDPKLKSKYEQIMCKLLTYLVEPLYIKDITTHNYNIINSNRHQVIVDDPKPLIDYIVNRSQRLRDTLTGLGVDCDD